MLKMKIVLHGYLPFDIMILSKNMKKGLVFAEFIVLQVEQD